MSDTTIPIPAQIDPPMAQAAPSISVGDIKVEGNITGNIVVGNGNVIGDRNVVYQVHNYHGAIVKWHEAPPISPRDIKPLAPREPRGFVGREDELKTLEEKIRNKQALVLYGLDGLGKTALLKKVANSAEAKAMPDGVFYAEKMYEGDEPGLQDILQRLFDQLFESNPPRKVTDAIAALHLQHTSPLIILDQTGLPPTSLNRLPDMFPGGAVLVAEQTALFVDVFESIEAGPLHREEAIQLFLLKSGLDPDASARQSAQSAERRYKFSRLMGGPSHQYALAGQGIGSSEGCHGRILSNCEL